MSAAKKRHANQQSMSPQSRRAAYGKLNILWLQLRPDLKFEGHDTIRDERLAWVASVLGIKRLNSTATLSDAQLGLVLDKMQNLIGTASQLPVVADIARPPLAGNVVDIADYRQPVPPELTDAEVLHLAGEAQVFTINKLVGSIGWDEEHFREFLFSKFRRRSPRMLTFKQCNSLTMILLTIAADKELRAQGATKITRMMTADYIPTIKKNLGIDQ